MDIKNLTAEEKVKYGFDKDQVTFKDAYENWMNTRTAKASDLLQKMALEIQEIIERFKDTENEIESADEA